MAMIGAAAYGMPIAQRIKAQLNRSALVLGGASQLLFGIRGQRWGATLDGVSNERWMFPLASDQHKLDTGLIDGLRNSPYGSSKQAPQECPHPYPHEASDRLSRRVDVPAPVPVPVHVQCMHPPT